MGPRMLAEEAVESWALLSDTHIAGDRSQTNRNVNMADHLVRTVKEVVAWGPSSGTLVAGDCAYGSGQPADYRAFTQVVQPLRERGSLHLLLGNHDHRDRFWEALAGTKTEPLAVPARHVGVVPGKQVTWYLLDSLETTNITPGLLGQEQLAWLARRLDEAPQTPAVVVVHHNPGVLGNTGLRDTVALFETIRPRKQVKALVYGHTHAWSVDRDETGLHLVNLPPTAYVFTESAPSGWVQAVAGEGELRLTLRCLDQAHRLHGHQERLAYRA